MKGKGSGTDETMDNQKFRFEIHTNVYVLSHVQALPAGPFWKVTIHPETGGGGGQKTGGSQKQVDYPQSLKWEYASPLK